MLWTRADSDALDAYASRHWVSPLRPEKRLWDLLAPDRAARPYVSRVKAVPAGPPRPLYCRGTCHRLLRGRTDPLLDGYILHRGHGYCGACYDKLYGKSRDRVYA